MTDELKAKETARCKLCGEPMPEGEEMFFYHGYSGKCPKPKERVSVSAKRNFTPEEKFLLESQKYLVSGSDAFNCGQGHDYTISIEDDGKIHSRQANPYNVDQDDGSYDGWSHFDSVYNSVKDCLEHKNVLSQKQYKT